VLKREKLTGMAYGRVCNRMDKNTTEEHGKPMRKCTLNQSEVIETEKGVRASK